MFVPFTKIKGLRIRATDGQEGSVDDLYVDDRAWRVRYLVADVGVWLLGHQGLLGVDRLGPPDLATGTVPVTMTAAEVAEAPSVESDPPVSEQERFATDALADPWPPFLLGTAGAGYTPILAEQQVRKLVRRDPGAAAAEPTPGDPHLRSLDEVRGYGVAARDGEIGEIGDFLIAGEGWWVRHLVIDTGGWLPGRRVVLPTGAEITVDWHARSVVLDLERERIESAPEVESVADFGAREDEAVARHFGMPIHWTR